MAKSKLKSALERHKGVDHKKERQKKLQKQAEKKKRETKEAEEEVESAAEEVEKVLAEDSAAAVNGAENELQYSDDAEWEDEDEEDDEEDAEEGAAMLDASRLDDSDTSEDENDMDDGEAENADEGDIPLSDIESLASEEKGDILPHQRLTINNTTALLKSLKRIQLPVSSLPFSAHQSVTSSEPITIPDIEDDLNRELSFYKQSLEAVKEARTRLKKESVPFSRPVDYFAEMVKNDEHMSRVKKRLVDEAASKKAAQEARRQRDLKKFGKQVQTEKRLEREKAKRDTLDRINTLKRKRSNAPLQNDTEGDLFDVALEDAATTTQTDRAARKASGSSRGGDAKPNAKRQKRNDKYGYGGKKRHAKSGDALSSADMSGFSTKKMKAGAGAKGKAKRPGKDRRAKGRM